MDTLIERFLSRVEVRSQSFAPKDLKNIVGLKNTVRAYKTDLRQFKAYCDLQFLTLEQIEVRHIDDFLATLSNEKAKRTSRPLSSRSRARKKSCLSSFFRFLRKEKVTKENPLLEADKYPFRERSLSPLTVAEINILRNNCPERDCPLLEFLLASGARENEAATLTWDRVDMKRRSVKLLGKREKTRYVWFSTLCAEELSRIREDSSFVFRKPNGESMSPSYIYYRINRLSQYLGRSVYPHLLRHTFASHLVSAGESLASIAKWLGHEKVSTTSIYVQEPEENRDSYDSNIRRIYGAKSKDSG